MTAQSTTAALPTRPGRRTIPLLPELGLAAIGLAAYFIFPADLALLTQIAIMALFVLSLSLVLGQTGIATLGHAVFLGVGAYGAGLFALHVSSDPILGLVVGGVAGALLALVFGALLLRTHGLTFLMLTIAVGQIAYEVVNSATSITGGDDGLSGYTTSALFGLFKFDFYSRTAFLYALAVLVISFAVLRIITNSPFGETLRGIRSDHRRMKALGNDIYRQQLIAFTIGGVFAGLAGALSAQTTQVVGMSSLGFTMSGDALVMLIVGGSRKLPGAILGTVVFMLVHHFAATINPYHWQFAIGALLIFCVLVVPQGLWGLVEQVASRFGRKGGAE